MPSAPFGIGRASRAVPRPSARPREEEGQASAVGVFQRKLQETRTFLSNQSEVPISENLRKYIFSALMFALVLQF